MTEAAERTIAFVDLAGFTALTEVHGDNAAVDVLDTFNAAVRTAVGDSGAELVKTIGDAVMLAALTPAAGLVAVRQVFDACYATDAFPEPRGGLHHGPVVAKDGDYFGATVNLAARARAERAADRRSRPPPSRKRPAPPVSTSSSSATTSCATSSNRLRCGPSSCAPPTSTSRSIPCAGCG